MGYSTCGRHPKRRCCWRCDRCPECDADTGRLGKGDYCRDCQQKCEAEGYVWSDWYENYHRPAYIIKMAEKLKAENYQNPIPQSDINRARRAILERQCDNLFTTEGRSAE